MPYVMIRGMSDKSRLAPSPTSEPLEVVYTVTFEASQWHTTVCWKVDRQHVFYRAFITSIRDWPLALAEMHHCVTDALGVRVR